MFERSTGYKVSIIAASAAIMVFASCKRDVEPVPFDMEQIPTQTVNNVAVIQSEKGNITMRMTAPLLQHFKYSKAGIQDEYDYYPEGIFVMAYTDNGALETTVTADKAKHITLKGAEKWMAFGNVVVINHIKSEKMESDTIYWNQAEKKIHTDCYVKMTSRNGMMQGYGMISDDRARNSEILKPFDSYSVMTDSTDVYIDTLNFVGPKVLK